VLHHFYGGARQPPRTCRYDNSPNGAHRFVADLCGARPFGEFVAQVMSIEPYASARRVYWSSTAARSACRTAGCHQIRSRSPIQCAANYALKVETGYSVHPSPDNDSYYFIKTLRDGSE
jgi:hypothetical protein